MVATLITSFETDQPTATDGRFRIRIQNTGDVSATGVRVFLKDIKEGNASLPFLPVPIEIKNVNDSAIASAVAQPGHPGLIFEVLTKTPGHTSEWAINAESINPPPLVRIPSTGTVLISIVADGLAMVNLTFNITVTSGIYKFAR